LPEPEREAVGVGGAAEIMEVTVIDELRVVLLAAGDLLGDFEPRIARRLPISPRQDG
jgi:hypothetical protein